VPPCSFKYLRFRSFAHQGPVLLRAARVAVRVTRITFRPPFTPAFLGGSNGAQIEIEIEEKKNGKNSARHMDIAL
jgi:hypothetical protein